MNDEKIASSLVCNTKLVDKRDAIPLVVAHGREKIEECRQQQDVKTTKPCIGFLLGRFVLRCGTE